MLGDLTISEDRHDGTTALAEKGRLLLFCSTRIPRALLCEYFSEGDTLCSLSIVNHRTD